MNNYLTQFFEFRHLSPNLQEVCQPFAMLVERVLKLPHNPERTVCLRKILEAKDCAVRASQFKPEGKPYG